MGVALARAGRLDEVPALVEKLCALEATEYISPYAYMVLYMALGDIEKGLHEAERLVEHRSAMVVYLRPVPRFRPLRAHPRFQRILHQLWPDDFPQPAGASES